MGYTLTYRKVVPPGDSLLALALWGSQCFRVDPKTNRSPRPAMPRTWDSFKTSHPGSRKGEHEESDHVVIVRPESLALRKRRRAPIEVHRRCGAASILCLTAVLLAACSHVGIDSSQVPALSNDDTYATLGYLWGVARTAITSQKEPLTSPFSLPLVFSGTCPSGGQRAYQGTLAGTDSSGTGSATLTMTATLTLCAFDDGITIRKITATGVSVSGTIAISGDTYGATNVHLTAANVTVNGTTCTGGMEMIVVASAPLNQATATGTACGRSGAVPLP